MDVVTSHARQWSGRPQHGKRAAQDSTRVRIENVNRQQLLAASGAIIVLAALAAQAKPSVWDGIYSTDQAKRGEAAYATDCASCHGAKLEGRGQTPALSGAEFLMNWDGTTVGDLFEKIQASMPADKPGTLSPERNAEILAFLLSVSKMPAGATDLPGDIGRLRQIRFDAARPKQ
jgi:quinoprotein glucose dehydrogenase